MISRWPDSTAASTASSVASGSNGTSNVTSITGRLPETPGMSALVRVRRVPSTATPAAASSSACCVSTWSAARRRSCGTTSSAHAITSTNRRNANWMSDEDAERDQDQRRARAAAEHEQPVPAHVRGASASYSGGRDLRRVPRLAARRAASTARRRRRSAVAPQSQVIVIGGARICGDSTPAAARAHFARSAIPFQRARNRPATVVRSRATRPRLRPDQHPTTEVDVATAVGRGTTAPQDASLVRRLRHRARESGLPARLARLSPSAISVAGARRCCGASPPFVAVFINTIYSELATMFPEKSGGLALYAHEAWRKYTTLVGPIATFGYWIGWSVVLSVIGLFIGSIDPGRLVLGRAGRELPRGDGYFSVVRADAVRAAGSDRDRAHPRRLAVQRLRGAGRRAVRLRRRRRC